MTINGQAHAVGVRGIERSLMLMDHLYLEPPILFPLSPVTTGSKIMRPWTWGSAALHPRLYALARSAG